MEHSMNFGQAAVIWGIVFAPCLAVALAALRMGGDTTEEHGRIS